MQYSLRKKLVVGKLLRSKMFNLSPSPEVISQCLLSKCTYWTDKTLFLLLVSALAENYKLSHKIALEQSITVKNCIESNID